MENDIKPIITVDATTPPTQPIYNRYVVCLVYKKKDSVAKNLPVIEVVCDIVNATDEEGAYIIVSQKNRKKFKEYTLVKNVKLLIPSDRKDNIFRKLRKERGLKLKDVCEQIGISSAHLCQLETSKIKKPNDETLKKLYAFYEIAS